MRGGLAGDSPDTRPPRHRKIPVSKTARAARRAPDRGGRAILLESLNRLGANEARFVAELLADLRRRHPHILSRAGDPEAQAVLTALRAFAASAAPSPYTADPDPDVVDLADSLMKTFALCLGRAAWKPAMALEWNAALRSDGARLLADLRAAQGGGA